jgi:hypothetical protein
MAIFAKVAAFISWVFLDGGTTTMVRNGHFNGFGQVWWICDLFLTSFNKRGKRISFCVIIANEIHYDNEQRLREETKGKHDGRSCFVWRQ